MGQFLDYISKKQAGGDIKSLPGVLRLSQIEKKIELDKQKSIRKDPELRQYTPKPGDMERQRKLREEFLKEQNSMMNRVANSPTFNRFMDNIVDPMMTIGDVYGLGAIGRMGVKALGKAGKNIYSDPEITKGFIDWGKHVDYKDNPGFDPRRYENAVKSAYTPPTTDPNLMPFLTYKDFKKGGMITDPRGQWAHPGKNTRIPGSSVTMQGVPYPVLAKASNGQTTMMYPGQEYQFPGAEYVDEFPMMQKGGQATTMDSLMLYKNQLAKEAFYKNNQGYRIIKPGPKTTKNSDIPNVIKDIKKGPKWMRINTEELNKRFGTNFTQKELDKRVGKVSPNVYSTPDMFWGYADNWFNPAAPPVYISDKIKPHHWVSYQNKKVTDISDIPMYNAQDIKPYHLLTPKEKAARDKKYPKPPVQKHAVEVQEPVSVPTPVASKPVIQEPPTVEQVARMYEGTPVYSPGAGSGMGSTLVGFVGKSGDTTYIQPQDYERYAVPAYGRRYIEQKTKQQFGGQQNSDNMFNYEMAYGGQMIRRADGSYSKRGLWDNIRANRGSGKKPTKEMLEQERKIRAAEKAMYGMEVYQQGGEPDGEMALGQINAALDKLMTLRQFIQPDSDLEPWVSSKLTMMDHYADAVSDYMMFNPEATEMMPGLEEMSEGGIPQRYKNMGFSRVGQRKESSRPGKKWMVLAKKGSDYKVVHGGYDGMKDFSQHGSEKRKERFWDRMGGKNSSKAKDPFSPLYWHKRLGTWADGGEIEMMKKGGSTFSGNAWYEMGGITYPFAQGGIHYGHNFAKQVGSPVEGDEMEVTPEQLEELRRQGYQFEII